MAPTPGGSNVPRAKTTSTSGHGAAYAGAATRDEPATAITTGAAAANQRPIVFITTVRSLIPTAAGTIAPRRTDSLYPGVWRPKPEISGKYRRTHWPATTSVTAVGRGVRRPSKRRAYRCVR